MRSTMFETLRMPQQNDAGSPFTVHCLCYDNNEISPPRTTRLQEQQQRQEAKENAESDKVMVVQPIAFWQSYQTAPWQRHGSATGVMIGIVRGFV